MSPANFQCCSLKQIPFVLNLPAILFVFYGMGIWGQTCVRPGVWCVRLRGCPPAFGLLQYKTKKTSSGHTRDKCLISWGKINK
jgi:hypothetical protein